MKKQNLVLVASFPTNRYLLKGLIEFLETEFKVHFVDLPGFTPEIPPLKEISIATYKKHIQEHIHKLKLKKYYLGGISFGFFLASQLPFDKKCEGYLGLEPFLGADSLHMNWLERQATTIFAKIINYFSLQERIWHAKWFRLLLGKKLCPLNKITQTLKQINPEAFFRTLHLSLTTKKISIPDWYPTALIMNPNDETVNYQYVKQSFEKSCKRLIIIEMSIEHYPSTITKSYFRRHLPPEHLEAAKEFFKREASQV